MLALRSNIRVQKSDAERYLAALQNGARLGLQAAPSVIQDLKFRTAALRALVDDLKKLADEIDPPPGPDAEFKKLMAEYDGVVLRLAEDAGRPGARPLPRRTKFWDAAEIRRQFGGRLAEGDQAVWLLEKRNEVRTQGDRVRRCP